MPTSLKDDTEKLALAREPTSPASHAMGNFAPTPWFQSSLVMSSPKITRKKVGHRDSDETSIIPKTNFDSEPSPSFDFDLFAYQDTDQVPQGYVNKPSQARSPTKNRDDATTEHTVGDNIVRATVEQETKQSPRHKHSDHVSPCSLAVETLEKPLVHLGTITPSHHFGETAGPDITLNVSNEIAVEFEPAHTPATASGLMSSRSFSSPLTKVGTRTAVTPENVAEHLGKKKYTFRQMGRVALVAANGSRMTTSQIIVWLAHTFSHLRVGKGSWEGSIRQTLSTFPEFHGQLIPGTRGNKKLYGFASAALRTQYEAEYPEFCMLPDALGSQMQSQQQVIGGKVTQTGERTTKMSKTKRTIKSAPKISTLAPTPKDNPSTPVITTEGPPLSTQSKLSPKFMPFERRGSRLSVSALHDDLKMERDTTLPTTHARAQPPADAMSEADQAQKIAEIKARPSRKQYFGSDHRLAHKRWRGLDDIHDECDGAWKRRVSDEKQPEQDEDTTMDDEDVRTLKEAFGLPDNMIPMNDGPFELAFRDGTLVRASNDT
jgi:hypothetical protein